MYNITEPYFVLGIFPTPKLYANAGLLCTARIFPSSAARINATAVALESTSLEGH
jgi:hypothetical protein